MESPKLKIRKLLVASRSEIAIRAMRAAAELGIANRKLLDIQKLRNP